MGSCDFFRIKLSSVSSKIPSRVRDGDEGVVGRNYRLYCFLDDWSLILPSRQINDFLQKGNRKKMSSWPDLAHFRLIPPSNSVFEAVSVLSPSNTSSLSEGSAYLVTLFATTSFGQLKSESDPLQETFLFNNGKSWQKLNTDQDGSGDMVRRETPIEINFRLKRDKETNLVSSDPLLLKVGAESLMFSRY